MLESFPMARSIRLAAALPILDRISSVPISIGEYSPSPVARLPLIRIG